MRRLSVPLPSDGATPMQTRNHTPSTSDAPLTRFVRQRFLAAEIFCAALPLLACGISAAAEPAESAEFFEKRIRPVLSEQCYKCHSSTSEKLKGGLMLDSREAVLKGGDTGPAITPGDPEVFAQVTLDPEIHTVVWPCGADFDPATLHDWPEHEAAFRAAAERWGHAHANA